MRYALLKKGNASFPFTHIVDHWEYNVPIEIHGHLTSPDRRKEEELYFARMHNVTGDGYGMLRLEDDEKYESYSGKELHEYKEVQQEFSWIQSKYLVFADTGNGKSQVAKLVLSRADD